MATNIKPNGFFKANTGDCRALFGESSPYAISFTQKYLATFEANLAKSKTSAQLIEKMKTAYPNLEGESDLQTSAKVLTDEMAW